MQSFRYGSRPHTPPLDNAFSPTYLARLRERDDSLTAAEAEVAGPWKIEPVPGRPVLARALSASLNIRRGFGEIVPRRFEKAESVLDDLGHDGRVMTASAS